MNDRQFENQVNQDVAQTKKDFTAFGEDSAAGLAKIKKDLTALGEDGFTGLGRKFEQLAGDTKEVLSVAANTLNKDVGSGLSQFNTKVQEVVDKVPGGFGKKAAGYPWVTITLSLAFGLLLGVLLKPNRQPVG
jgi:hypothetical protein